MKLIQLPFIICIFICNAAFATTIQSPSKNLTLIVGIDNSGVIRYDLIHAAGTVVEQSKLGFMLKDGKQLDRDFTMLYETVTAVDNTWQPVWGEVSNIRNNYTELKYHVRQIGTKIQMFIVFRLFDDGLGFRYEFPHQPELTSFIITDELTEFNLSGDHTAFWIPGDYDTNEYPYTKSKLSEVDAVTKSEKHTEIATRTPIGKNYVQTPLMMKTAGGLYINIHEAALVNYSAMQLKIDAGTFTLTTSLVPDAVGNKVYMSAPCVTPWRTIVVSDKATDILASKLILNLNEPSVINDVSWIKPVKYIGIWWDMHVGTATWNYSDVTNINLETTNWAALPANGKHGATTARTKYCIDFAAEHGFDAVLIEGWNVGWEDWFGKWKENVFDFVTPYPDFNVVELQQYAASKNVKLIMHHETSASVTNYERRLQEAMDFMVTYGYPAVKSGYVGRIIPRGEYHDGQWMVNHYNYVATQMAKNKLMLDAHEPVRPTGLHRTYPNWLACEAARGNEFNAWSQGNPPEHETILPFTRLMGGPMDYTPGIFEIKMDYYKPGAAEQVHTTLAKQLALYLTMYSPLQMAADLPENYLKYPDAFQFIKDVAVDWQDSKYLEAEPGDYITVARKAKNSSKWFVGAITDENKRSATIDLSFLDNNKLYIATVYADGADADWKTNPKSYQIKKFVVKANQVLTVPLAAGGGCAISIFPASEEDVKGIAPYKGKW
jgi:glucan 1,4-alpha-glucosidase